MHRTFELFSDIFAFRDNALSRLDARVKLLTALWAILAVILSTKLILPLAMCLCCTGLMFMLRVPARLIVVRMAPPTGIALVICLVRPFLAGSTPLFSVVIGGWKLAATREGMQESLLLGCRVLGAVSVVLLLGVATPAHKIFSALRWARFPRGWVEIAMLMYRYVFALLDDAADIFAAQQVRLGYSSLRRSLASTGVLAGAVILRSVDQAEKTHAAMVARGYQGSLPIGSPGALPRRDAMVGAACVAAIALAFILIERPPL